VRTVEDVMQSLAVPAESIAKTLIYWADGEYVGALSGVIGIKRGQT
jgi:hypothetical protein